MRLKKTLITVLAITLLSSVFLLSNGAMVLGSVYKKLFVVDKPGVGQFEIEGQKDVSPEITPPPSYDPGQREWKGSVQDQQEIKRVVREAFQAERDAMREDNRGRGAEFKNKLAGYFSPKHGELNKRQGYIENNNQMSDSSGITIADSGISKLDFKGVSIDGTSAVVVVDEWAWARYKQAANNGNSSQSAIPPTEAKNARQHNLELELEGGSWKITSDKWVFVPGTEP